MKQHIINSFFKRLALMVVLEMALVYTGAVQAVITSYSNNNIFRVDLLEKGAAIPGDPMFLAINFRTLESTRDVSEYQSYIMTGINYWDELLSSGGTANSLGQLSVFGFDLANAAAASVIEDRYTGSEYALTSLQDQIVNGVKAAQTSYYGFGTLSWFKDPYVSVISPNHQGASVVITSAHELAHALGLTANSDTYSSAFQSHLYLRLPGTSEYRRITHENLDSLTYEIGKGARSGLYFRGENVSAVLNGAIDNQIVINGFDENLDMSHIELQNSFLSHQNWRNYNNLMEAEIAVFEDIGYRIDRRGFYGSSEYADGKTYVNYHPFYGRTADGDAYITGKPNTSTMGVGFHVYGKNNNIIQAADLLADGTGAVGIRIDGAFNTITVAEGTKVTANGDHGYGVLVSYGKGHHVINRGSIEATGNGGVAVRFDFGSNILGDELEFRGSYMRQKKGVDKPISGETDAENDPYQLNLDGALVSNFDLSGSLEGQYASIFIAKNALVSNINVLNGAAISGDIISEWDPDDSRIQGTPEDLFTHLNFGYGINADGSSTGLADNSFFMILNGSVKGFRSIRMNHAAGTLYINGTVEAYSLENSGRLAIRGTDAEKYSANIRDLFKNNSGAILETEFCADGTIDGRIKASRAELAGIWQLNPNQEFFRNNLKISPKFPVDAALSGSFETVTVAKSSSPVLSMRLINSSVTNPEIEVYREPEAYSQYGKNSGDASVGNALYEISSVALGDMQNLLVSLDYSDRQGRTIASALKQLGPGTFDYGTMTAIRDSSAITGEMMRHMQGTMLATRYSSLYNTQTLLAANNYDLSSGGIRVTDRKVVGFIIPYGDFTKQSGSSGLDDMKSYSGGVVLGAESVGVDGVSYGIHGGASFRNTRISAENSSRIESRGLFLGLHGSAAPAEWGGFYAEGQFKAGWYENDSKRSIDFNGYSQKAKGNYDSLSAALMLGGGYDITSGSLSYGPLVYAEYNYVHNRGFTEKNANAAALEVKSSNAESLQLSLGAHLFKMWLPSATVGVSVDLRAGVKHEFGDNTFHTRAAFNDYSLYTFESYTKGAGRNRVFFQSELNVENRPHRIFGSLTAGYEHHKNADIFNVGIKAGWRF